MRHAALVMALSLVASACSGDDDSNARTDVSDIDVADTALSDAAADAPDAAGDADPADVDASTDVLPDGSTDTAPDAVEDAGVDAVADVAADATVDADVGPPFEGMPGAPLDGATCTPAADACVEGARLDGTWASYRKDAFFTDDEYNEYTDSPVDGGRFHVVGIATTSGIVTDVRIDGVSLADRVLGPTPTAEWWHVWPDPVVAGAPVWVAFHSAVPSWDATGTGRVEVQVGETTALDAPFDVAIAAAPLTFVTTVDDGATLLVHLRNDTDAPLTLAELYVDGTERLAAGATCVVDPVLAPGQTRLIEVPLCEPAVPGDPWTVVATFAEDVPPSVGAGRVLREFFPVEAWPSSSDCPVLTDDGPTDGYVAHRDGLFDTVYLYWNGGPPRCPTPTADHVNRLLPASDDGMHVLIGDDFDPFADGADTWLTDTSRVAGFLTGDESDGQVYDSETGAARPENKARRARALWRMYPEVTVYNGAKTNGHVGAFAGMTDVQGMDLYVAACPPHITFEHPPLRGAYDYLRNTRDNHMPWPTWLYAQGVHSGWNLERGDEVIVQQPDRGEILVQAWAVIAAGGKGLMWFQTTLREVERVPETFEAMVDSNRVIRRVRRWLREGDVTGLASVRGDAAIVEAIRARDAIVVPVIHNRPVREITDAICLEGELIPERQPHWEFIDQTLDVFVDVPADFAVTDVFEITLDGAVVDAPFTTNLDDRIVRIDDVPLDQDVPVRLFVLAPNDEARAWASEGD